ncbi:polysaccharide deacetylase family protein [Pelomonas sp. V22]|uniref:polysaccharide deacetylase family protein n=1 Tax=Pelomonas sp. V22 TaxID=2822139 RepID=UPI0024A84A93|nr:polysaccharide deacetylase family protein [Pelomonas sp. V22]MDI4631697.1 polysaccharide deacetylase family protein [Pelomonas sp. V22]
MIRTLMGLASPAGPRARLSILIFHRVLDQPDPLFPGEIDRQAFDAICGWLRDWFQVLPLDEAMARLQRGDLPARAAAITFDDGYADNEAIALPILQKHGLPATFYIATAYLNGGRMWNDSVIESIRLCPEATLDLTGTPAAALGQLDLGSIEARRAAIGAVLSATKYLEPGERQEWAGALQQRSHAQLPKNLMMSSEQVRALRRAGMLIGAHTMNHPILARLSEAEAETEIAEGRDALEQLIGEPVRHFAYPNGKPVQDYDAASVAIVKRLGFDSAVSTAWGAASAATDLHQVPRFSPWDRSRGKFGLRLLKNLMAGPEARL